MGAPDQAAKFHAPRRGAIIALEVDSTARSYNIQSLALGGKLPDAAGSVPLEVDLFMQAETNDVFFHFRSDAGAADLSDTAKVAAGATLAFDNTYAALLEAGERPTRVRINRALDKYLVVKAATTSGVLRFWAVSDAE